MPRILHLEDDPLDHKLVRAALVRETIDGDIEWVDSESAFREKLRANRYDLILADYNLRGFDGFRGLKIAKDICPATPFVVVSGAMGDMAVADILRAGATDFVLKDHLDRLGPAIQRALREADERAARQRAEEAMRIARDAAEAANRAKDQFLAMLSHELRTPLSPVVMAVTSIQSDPDLPTKFRDDLTMIRRNIDLEVALIDDLLDLSRVITGKLRLREEPLSLHNLIHHIVADAATEAKQKHQTIEPELEAKTDAVCGDSARLQQVFWNLIRNSIKFTPPHGRIKIKTLNPDDQLVRVVVADTGCGIPADALPRIFEPFEQVSGEITRESGGLGLGLTIVKAVVEQHGGATSATSEGEGRGATFVVELPTLNSSSRLEPGAAPASPGRSAADSRSIRVLLVEDHGDTARLLARLLRMDGFDVQVAGSMAAAMETASTHTFDVVVSDIGLPDASGHELMEALRRQYGLKGIALTGFGMEDDIARGRAAGFADHIVKPVDLEQLRRTILTVAGIDSGD